MSMFIQCSSTSQGFTRIAQIFYILHLFTICVQNDEIEENENFLQDVWLSYGAHVQLNGQVNSKKLGLYPPDEVACPKIRGKCIVWWVS